LQSSSPVIDFAFLIFIELYGMLLKILDTAAETENLFISYFVSIYH